MAETVRSCSLLRILESKTGLLIMELAKSIAATFFFSSLKVRKRILARSALALKLKPAPRSAKRSDTSASEIRRPLNIDPLSIMLADIAANPN